MIAIRRLHEILRGVLGFEPELNRKIHEHGLNDEDLRFLAKSVYNELGWDVPPDLLREMTPKEMEKEVTK